MTFFAIDIGNTRLKWALYAAPRPGSPVLAQGAVFLENVHRLAENDWKALPAPGSMLGCNVAGDAVRKRVEEQLELWDIEPHWVVPNAHTAGVSNGYDHPNRLGADHLPHPFPAVSARLRHQFFRPFGRRDGVAARELVERD